jgi:2-polyprenyl-3-methyl-5-hydroxy-6-metoxy-1,4-benzoquinol methylase
VTSLAHTAFSADAGYYGEVRPSLVALLPEKPRAVLDVGCGRGGHLKICRERGAERLAGIELRADVADALRAEGWAEVLAGSVEELDLSRFEGAFDLIIASFVLEHVADPWTVLARLKTLLAPGGRLIGALPNVRYWRVALPLLVTGDWTYVEEGVMDRTHLRFFTRRTMRDLFAATGFACETLQPICGGRLATLANRLTVGAASGLLAWGYDFVLKAE